MGFIENLDSIIGVIDGSLEDEIKRKVLVTKLDEVSPEILRLFPTEDVKTDIVGLLESLKTDTSKFLQLRLFISKIKYIVIHKAKHLPLGIQNVAVLNEIKSMVMSALNEAAVMLQTRFNVEPKDISDTKVYIVGSRVRGYSFDGKRLFGPVRDLDILIVGDNLFELELDYMRAIGKNQDARKFDRKGFIAGANSRYVPPNLAKKAPIIKSKVLEGDKEIFGKDFESTSPITFHLCRLNGEGVVSVLENSIECL